MFDQFELTGEIPPLAETIEYYEAQEPAPIDTHSAGSRHDALPLGGDVVTFPDAETEGQAATPTP